MQDIVLNPITYVYMKLILEIWLSLSHGHAQFNTASKYMCLWTIPNFINVQLQETL